MTKNDTQDVVCASSSYPNPRKKWIVTRSDKVFEEGRWILVNDDLYWEGEHHAIITALHSCIDHDSTMPWGRWTSSHNVVEGECNRCSEKVPESISTLWYIHNMDLVHAFRKVR